MRVKRYITSAFSVKMLPLEGKTHITVQRVPLEEVRRALYNGARVRIYHDSVLQKFEKFLERELDMNENAPIFLDRDETVVIYLLKLDGPKEEPEKQFLTAYRLVVRHEDSVT